MSRLSFSVKARIAATSAALVAITLTAVTAVVVTSSTATARRSAEAVTAETAGRYAGQLQAEISNALGTARDVRDVLGAARANGMSRRHVEATLRAVLAGHPEYIGVSVGWEPNAFDGKDKQPGAELATTDASGRHIPYWYRDGTVLALTALVDYETPGAGDYYLVPKSTRQEKVASPYVYDVGGKPVLMTTVSAPILEDGRFLGVFGVDIALSTLQEKVAALKVYDTGSAQLVATDGSVVAGPDADAVGKPATDDVARAVAAAEDGPHTSTVEVGGERVLRVATPIALGAQDTWTLVVDVPQSAVLADANRLRDTILLVVLLSLVVAAGLAFLAARRLVRPIDALRHRMTEISEGDGDLTQRVDESADDEIGQLGRAFNRFVEKVAATVREIGRTSAELGASASTLSEVSGRLAASTDAASGQAAQLAAASRQVDANVQTVAAGTEEMGTTAREIASSAAAASQLVASGVAAAASAGTTIASLGTSSAEIGAVVKTITAIAEQTNLLALNATIEAARAGESGKGFAVVAGEVKDLAHATAQATDDIIARVTAIQADARRATEGLSEIAATIGAVDESQSAIAAAVEEQAATVQSMSRTIGQAADGTTAITVSITDMDTMTVQASTGAGETAAAARELDQLAERLRVLVGDFRC